jgi:glutaredoxin
MDNSLMTTKVFALSTCPPCRRARAFLAENKVDYEVVEVDLLPGAPRERAIEEVRALTGSLGFPVIVIRGDVVVGFNQARLEQLLGL